MSHYEMSCTCLCIGDYVYIRWIHLWRGFRNGEENLSTHLGLAKHTARNGGSPARREGGAGPPSPDRHHPPCQDLNHGHIKVKWMRTGRQQTHPGITMSFRNINPSKVATIKHINNLITCLVNIKDETGQFLMPLADGRVIDTKGWEDWEVSVSCHTCTQS